MITPTEILAQISRHYAEALIFPPYIERVWGLCESVNNSGVSTALYSKVGYEDI